MALTWRQGAGIFAVSFWAALGGGCTYDEEQLRGVARPQDARVIDDAPLAADLDNLAEEAGEHDGPSVDAGAIDTAIDAPAHDAGIDAAALAGLDGKAVDGASPDGLAPDARDVPLVGGGVDSSVDTSALEVSVSEAGRVDGMTPG